MFDTLQRNKKIRAQKFYNSFHNDSLIQSNVTKLSKIIEICIDNRDHGMGLPVSLHFRSFRDSSIILFGKQPVKTPLQSVPYDFWSYGSILRYWDQCKKNQSIYWFVTTSWRHSSITKSRILFSIACTEPHVQALHFLSLQLFDSIKTKRAF